MALPSRSSAALWGRRFLLALLLSSLSTSVAVAGGYWYLNAKWDGAKRVDVQLDPPDSASNFLILGSDSRGFVESEEDRESFGQVGGRRADTIIVVRVDPGSRHALLASFPRDLWVEIPGRGNAKINSAFQDGPQGVIDTIRHNFDIPIHHYVEIDFAGFRNLVDAMGGVQMYVPAPSRDLETGLHIEDAGCTMLDGEQALAWVRSRNYQYFESGQWRSDPTGDFGRITRQQDFLRRLIDQTMEAGARNPLRVDSLIDTGLENLTVGRELGVGDVLKLARVFRSGDPDDVDMQTVPSVVGRRGSASVVLATEEAEALYERLRGDEPLDALASPSSTSVRVLNGNGTSGLATETAGALREVGFVITGFADADHYGYETTEIRHRADAEAKAELLRSYLGDVGRLIQDDGIGDVDVLAVLGADFAGVQQEGGDGGEGDEDAGAAGATGAGLDRALPVASVRGQEGSGGSESSGSAPAPEC